jgi:hypothetical protein
MGTNAVKRTIQVKDGAAVWRRIDDETVVLALDTSMYLGLNQTASELWPRLVAGTTRRDLVDHLVEAFEIDDERANADVDMFIEQCRRHHLLVE